MSPKIATIENNASLNVPLAEAHLRILSYHKTMLLICSETKHIYISGLRRKSAASNAEHFRGRRDTVLDHGQKMAETV